MSNVYFSAKVEQDGTLRIPDFVTRALGYEPDEEISVTVPLRQYLCDCEDSELFLSRCCAEAECAGYSSDGDSLNIPVRLMSEAEIPIGRDVSVLIGNGALVIVAAESVLEDLPSELYSLLADLGINPLTVRTMSEE